MLNYLILYALLFFSFQSVAFQKDQKELDMEIMYSIDSVVYDSNLSNNESIIHIHLLNAVSYSLHEPSNFKTHVLYAINSGENKTATFTMMEPQVIIERVKPGDYTFQLYLDSRHKEVSIPSFQVSGKQHVYISCKFEENDSPIRVQCEKPVIYLYPEQKMDVNVQVNPNGKLIFSYPKYQDGWSVTATPTGDIELNSKTYNYLFWESEFRPSITSIQTTEGFVVDGKNTTEFLEEKLSEFGLTSKEQADFITYWAPRMMRNEVNFVHFSFNEECEQYAHLDISPKPDAIYRIYIEYFPLENSDLIEIKPQKITHMNRTGFTVIEWGGIDYGPLKEAIPSL